MTNFLRDMEAKLRAVKDPRFTIAVDADTSQAMADIERFSREWRDLEVTVDADTTAAESTIERTRTREKAKPFGIDVQADVEQARAEIAAMREREQREALRLRVEFDDADAVGKLQLLRQRAGTGSGGSAGGMLKLNAAALGLGELPAAATALATVADGLQQVAQAGLVLPGVFAGAAASIGTAALGFKGMGDAIGALNEAAASGDPKDLQKAADALKDMAPNAVGVAKSISALRPEFVGLQNLVQQNMFDGLDKSITDVSGRMLPTLRQGLGGISTAWNGTLKELARVSGSESTLNIMDRIFGNTGDAQKRANAAIEPLVAGLGTLAAAGSDSLPRLADGLTAVLTRLQNFVTAADQDGRLQKWIDDGITGVTNLGRTVLNIGKSFTAITSAAGGGGQFLEWLSESTDRLQTFLNSAQGQDTLRRFFAEGREQLAQLLPLLENLAEVFGGVYEAAKAWTAFLIPALTTVTDLLTAVPGGVEAVAFAFIAWKSMAGVNALLSSLSRVDGLLGSINGKADGAGGTGPRGANGKPGKFGRVAPAAGILAAGTGVASSSDSGAGQAIGVLSAAGGGALAGSVFGPWGTAIGGALGTGAGIFGVIQSNIRQTEEATDAATAAARAYDDQLAAMGDTMDAIRGVQRNLNDALLASGGQLDDGTMAALQDRLATLPDQFSADPLLMNDPGKAKAAAEALDNLKLNPAQLAETVAGGQPLFDAMLANLQKFGPAGQVAIDALSKVRDEVLSGQDGAAAAAGTLQTVADKMGVDIPQAAANIKTAFESVPRDVPINVDMPQGEAILELLKAMNVEVAVDNDKTIRTTAPLAPAVIETLKQITGLVVNDNDKTIKVGIDTAGYQDAIGKLGTLGDMLRNLPVRQNAALPPMPTNPNTMAGDPFALPPPKREGGPTPSGGRRGPGPTGGWFAEVHSDEWILPAHARSAVGDQALWALTEGRSFRPGGFIDEHGNPSTPGGPLPGPASGPAPGGIGALADGFLANIGGPAANLGSILGIGGNPAAGTPGDTDTGTKIIPGLWGLPQAGNDPDMLSQWGKQTGDWLGNFGAETLMSFGTTLYKGLLGAVGLENSILSPDNQLFQAAAQSAGFFLGADGPFGQDPDGNPKAATSKQLREGTDKITDADGRVAQTLARLNELAPDAKESTRIGAQNELDKAKREAQQARDDFATLRAGGTSRSAAHGTGAGIPQAIGAGDEQGLQLNTLRVKRAVNALWPQLTDFSGKRDDPLKWHPNGLAIDVMIPGWDTPQGKALGDQIYAYMDANKADFGIDYILWQEKDHYNHLHINTTGGGDPQQAQNGYLTGGHTPGSKTTPIPALLHGDEFVHRNEAVEKYGLDFMNAVNDLRLDPDQIPHLALGGMPRDMLKMAAVRPSPPPAPRIEARPKMPQPAPAPSAPAPGPPARQAPTPTPMPAPAPAPPPVAMQPPPTPQQAPSFSPDAGSGASGPAGSTDYTLPWVNTAIESGATAIGNAAAAAASMGSMGMGGGGMGALIQGGVQQAGKIVKGVANVISSTLVGSVPGSFMTTPEAYGRTQRSEQNVPQTAMPPYRSGGTYNIQGVDTRNMLQELSMRENIEAQSALAAHPGRI